MQAERKRPDTGFVVPSVERAQMRAVRQEDGAVDSVPSPTHLLQHDLATRLAQPVTVQPSGRVWSSRLRFSFIMTVSAGLWMAVWGVVTLIL